MSRLCQFIFCLFALAGLPAQAQNPPLPPPLAFPRGATNLLLPLPPVLQLPSPVGFFRQLLAMAPSERANSLTNRPPEARARILAKVREYQLLGPDERELRLRATELRWYLTPLLRVPSVERSNRLARVPDDLRGLIQSRLTQWDILPPPLQQEFLANDQALHYFARVETTNPPAATAGQQEIAAQFNRFFELTPAEKKQTLNTLSAAERAQMGKTLQTFAQLPPQQRIRCIRNYAKFAGMSAAERAEFLKNAEHWSQMSPNERQTWRDLVAQVPVWPPLPSPAVPANLIPRAAPRILRPNVATNLD
jgi:hypothetical protein